MKYHLSKTAGHAWWMFATAAFLLLAGNAGAQQKAKPTTKFDGPAALNAAARQPMLAERITKSFSLVGQKVLEFRSRRQLEDSVKEFEAGLKSLQASAPTPEIRENYQLLEQLFEEFKGLTGKTANLENAKPLAEQNEELVWIATKGAQLIQQHTKSARSDLIGTAGEMRTLTQRIAKLYLFRSWGIRSDVIANDLKKAEADYRADMDRLVKAPQNTDQIKSELALAETQWLFLKQAIERLNANKTSITELEHVSKACDNILDVMERVTRLYEGVKS
ncbi:MAG: type IV pili methyl-accepting chemotaxis transducer N-terminal domain-containing protein [Burkholderiales bacterium]|nr:type IV pili methyl-accepting chemotaxis transducer N-terminal domain-containing protein [Burkholderiales bacterium]